MTIQTPDIDSFITAEQLRQHYQVDAVDVADAICSNVLPRPVTQDGSQGWPAQEIAAAEDNLRAHWGIGPDGWNYDAIADEVEVKLAERQQSQCAASTATCDPVANSGAGHNLYGLAGSVNLSGAKAAYRKLNQEESAEFRRWLRDDVV